MVPLLRNLLPARNSNRDAAIPPGERVYAIGDVHGRLDLFSALVQAIEKDDRRRGKAQTTVIMLGDLIDRGPSSARVIASARAWANARKVRFLAGNHEEMFLRAFYNPAVFSKFIKYGGLETILSYGVDRETLDKADIEEAINLMHKAVPKEDREFLRDFETMAVIGDYVFVHAGIRPAQPLEKQKGSDCRWIREPFLGFLGAHSHMVVHGHTVVDEPEFRRNRIAVDTGAYATGRLTALCLEGRERRIIQAHSTEEGIETLESMAA